MIKICIWMNIPSHHQAAFFAAISRHQEIDLQVKYFHAFREERRKEGWTDGELQPYEKLLPQAFSPAEMMESVLPDWKERIHLISYNYYPPLSEFLCANHARWCHWSDRAGRIVAELVGFRMHLYCFLLPLYLLWKRRSGKRINAEAFGVFCTGKLTGQYFSCIGIDPEKTANLFYAVDGIASREPFNKLHSFTRGRKAFLYVGSLSKLKGIDILLQSFAMLDSADWCLILCGADKSRGKYQRMAKKLGITDRVYFFGTCDSGQIGQVYSAADVLVFPTRFDGWGMVLNEAASIGMPLIGSDMAGASHEVIEDGRNGFMIKSDSIPALTEAMRCYVDHPALIKVHGKYSKEKFIRELTPEVNADRLVVALRKWMAKISDEGST